MDKFTSQVQVEETADFQEWLDAQEVADIRAMEADVSPNVGGSSRYNIASTPAASETLRIIKIPLDNHYYLWYN